jgi:hypothetical protein
MVLLKNCYGNALYGQYSGKDAWMLDRVGQRDSAELGSWSSDDPGGKVGMMFWGFDTEMWILAVIQMLGMLFVKHLWICVG